MCWIEMEAGRVAIISWPRGSTCGHQIPQVILRYPYAGMDYSHDPDMVFPLVEDWDQTRYVLYYDVL
jgi:hypothetical protein